MDVVIVRRISISVDVSAGKMTRRSTQCSCLREFTMNHGGDSAGDKCNRQYESDP